MSLFTEPEADPDTLDDSAPKDIPFTQARDFEMPSKPKTRKSNLRKDIESTYAAIGLMVFPFDQMIGSEIANNAEQIAEAWDELAGKNPAVKRALENLLKTSAYGTVIAAHAPILVAVATKYVPNLRASYESNFNGEG